MVSDEDMAARMARGVNGDQREAPANEWMCGVSDDDLLREFVVWVLERGIKLIGRSIAWIMTGCVRCSGNGSTMVRSCD
jgi:hypothetical protein